MDSVNENQELAGVAVESPLAPEAWRWRMGIVLISFSAAWLVSGTALMWMLIWKPLAVGHALLWLYVVAWCSESMRRFYFRAIQRARAGRGDLAR